MVEAGNVGHEIDLSEFNILRTTATGKQTTTINGIRFSLGVNRDEGYETEWRDCTVRSLQNTTGVPYRDAHHKLHLEGRVNKHGIYYDITLSKWAGLTSVKEGRDSSILIGTVLIQTVPKQ
jgi:hypothetical protein